MSFRRRAAIVGVLAAMAVATYGTARYYSNSLVFYVVEQSLLQKSPPGTSPKRIKTHFQAMLTALPNPSARLERALAVSQYVEKVQTLTSMELEQLLLVTPETPTRGSS
jgi:hypothetical protein